MPSKDTQFVKGQSGNKKGRPRGSKNKVSKRVLNAIYRSLEDADESLKLLKSEDLAAFWRIAAAQIPKDLDIKQTSDVRITLVQYSDLSDDDDERAD